MKVTLFTFLLVVVCFISCKKKDVSNPKLSLIYYNASLNHQVKKMIKEQYPYFTSNYKKLLSEAEKALDFEVDPVTNKIKIPPSNNKHDYLSYAPL